MKGLIVICAVALGLAACTTAERTATGTVAGAVVGGAVTGRAGGAVVGALIGGLGTYIAETADGRCQYRNSKGQVYTTKCHWK